MAKLHVNLIEIENDELNMHRIFNEHIDPRRRHEYEDSQRVQEDHKAVANLSERGFQKEFNPDNWKPRYLKQ